MGDRLGRILDIIRQSEAIKTIAALTQTMTGKVNGMAIIALRREIGQKMEIPAAGVHIAAVNEEQGRFSI